MYRKLLPFLLVSATLCGAQCFEPVFCKGGALSTCVDYCLGLSDKIVMQSPALEVSHPECVIGCDSSCGQLCGGGSVVEEAPENTVMEAGPVSLPPPRHLRSKARRNNAVNH